MRHRDPISSEDRPLPAEWLTWVLVPIPTLLGLLVSSPPEGVSMALRAAAVSGPVAMLAVAVGFAAYQHQTHDPLAGWLSAGLTLPPVAIGLESIATGRQPTAAPAQDAATLYVIGGAISLAWVLANLRGHLVTHHPVALGMTGGAVTFATSHAMTAVLDTGPLPDGPATVVVGVASAGFGAAAVAAAWSVVHRDDLGRRVSWCLIAGCGALALGLMTSSGIADSSLAETASGALQLISSALLMTVAICLLNLVSRRRIEARLVEMAQARRREDDLRLARATIHEIRSTVAGLASATRLMADDHFLSQAEHTRLVAMGGAEIARMQRLLADGGPAASRIADLVDALEPVVESLRMQGHDVHLQGERGQTHAAPDEVARIVHVMLDNAARHGSGHIEVVVEGRVADLLISVTDDGPGVPTELRDRLFDWGVSGAGSSGIGLHDGSTRARAIGGCLSLASHGADLTRFELVLPLSERERP